MLLRFGQAYRLCQALDLTTEPSAPSSLTVRVDASVDGESETESCQNRGSRFGRRRPALQ